MFDFILGKEKAIIAGISAGLLSLLSSVGITGQMTVKDAVFAVATWVVVHVLTYITTNSKTHNTLVSKADDLAEDVIEALHIVNDRVTTAAKEIQADAQAAPQVTSVATIPPEVAEAMAKQLAEQAKQPQMHAPGNADGSLDATTPLSVKGPGAPAASSTLEQNTESAPTN